MSIIPGDCTSTAVFRHVCHLLLEHMLIAFSTSVYIMCVILCLFSALSRRVGALQISIIIIIYLYLNASETKEMCVNFRKNRVTETCLDKRGSG